MYIVAEAASVWIVYAEVYAALKHLASYCGLFFGVFYSHKAVGL